MLRGLFMVFNTLRGGSEFVIAGGPGRGQGNQNPQNNVNPRGGNRIPRNDQQQHEVQLDNGRPSASKLLPPTDPIPAMVSALSIALYINFVYLYYLDHRLLFLIIRISLQPVFHLHFEISSLRGCRVTETFSSPPPLCLFKKGH